MSIIPRPLKQVLGRIIPFSQEDKIPTFNLGSGTADNTTYLRGDGTWATVSGGGSAVLINGTATIDFGTENDHAQITVLEPLISTSLSLIFTYVPQETTATSLDDFSLNGVSFSIENIINATSFVIRGTALNSASGIYTIKYFICQQ
jgi:hypothetical protein